MIYNLEWKIRYDKENTSLDFKRELYTKEKYNNFIKDVMSMANAPLDGSRYVVIGVKESPNGEKEFFSVENAVDISTYEQLIRNNIEPTISIEYFPIKVDSHNLGVFEIKNCTNPPYMIKKDRGNLKKGDCFIRKGTQQEKAIRRDIDDMENRKNEYQFNNKIFFGFGEDLLDKKDVKSVKNITLPSDERKAELESQLERLKEQEIFDESQKEDTFQGVQAFKDISVGINGFFMKSKPTRESVQNQINEVKQIYHYHDIFYLEETISEKINFHIHNTSNKPLEKVEVILKFPVLLGFIAEDLPVEPNNDDPVLGLLKNPPSLMNGYPSVDKKDSEYIITEEIDMLRHKQVQPLFMEDLRVTIPEKNINQSFPIKYEIHASNLPDPIIGVLTINVL